MKSRVILFKKPKVVTFGEIDLPEPGPGQIITETILSGVSTGTETRVLVGEQPDTHFPLIPGYENVGKVIMIGKDVEDFEPGDRVFHSGSAFTGPYCRAWGAQVALALIRAEDAVIIPQSVSDTKAIYTKTFAIAYHGIKRAHVQAGEWIAIVGQGLIGHLATQCAVAQKARVIAVDLRQDRLDAALKAGALHALNPNHENIIDRVKDLTNDSLDVAVDVTGLATTANQTLKLLPKKPWGTAYQPSGRLLILGSYTVPVCFTYHGTLFDIEPDILIARDNVHQDYKDVLQLMQENRLTPKHLPAESMHYTQAPEAYGRLLAKDVNRLIFRWSTDKH